MNQPAEIKKRLVLAVTNDLVTDNRVHKVAKTLQQMGFDVTLAGRELPDSQAITDRSYSIRRFSLLFNTGPLFYANYNIRLFFYLIIKNFDVVVANDLDSLLGCFVATQLTKKPLVYDSHEYFTELPELTERPFIKKQWERLERMIVPRLKYCYTVCQSIADIYNTKYDTHFKVVRNIPEKKSYSKTDIQFFPPFPTDLPVIIYQGAVNMGRGIEEAVLAMHTIENARLVIVGDGDLLSECKELVASEKLNHKIVFTGRINIEELKKITPFATIGLTVEKNMGLNYYFALPNKLFDYIHSEVPVLATNLPEIKRVVETFGVGIIINEITPGEIASGIRQMLASPDQMKEWKMNCTKAKDDLCWENEEKILIQIFNSF